MAVVRSYVTIMISEEEARAKILETVRPLPSRSVPVLDALNCFAAEEYGARLPLPSFDNSAMDGYAVIAEDCRPGARLRVISEQPAGVDRQLQLSTGTTVRIFTGAPMPANSDAVVMQEDVTREENEIAVNAAVYPGQYIRSRECDLAAGQKILGAGERIRATTLALLTSQGFESVSVGAEARVAIISTGDELAKPGEPLRAGQIYESNSVLLRSLLQGCGAVSVSTQQCADDRDSLRRAFTGSVKNQIVIVNGGVSVGEHDLVQTTLRSLGARIDIWQVAIKPGKPFLFGRLGDCLIFGLPGNPVSAFVTFLQFVRPAILKLMGAGTLELSTVPAKLIVDLTNESDRPHYIRGKIEAGNFAPVGRQESHALFSLSQSNALVRVEVGESLKAGAIVSVQVWD
ncbi:MAG: gephyrin-like molybdotransferase Glp [Chthoniobacterales bacterium]